jgi:hypothetical protein
MDEQPNAHDWMMVGNDLRRAINAVGVPLGYGPLPLLDCPAGCPTEADLAEFERLIPGAAERLRESARLEMEHRKRLRPARP